MGNILMTECKRRIVFQADDKLKYCGEKIGAMLKRGIEDSIS